MKRNPMQKTLTPLLICLPLLACNAENSNEGTGDNKKTASTKTERSAPSGESNSEARQKAELETAYFASGCFWCVEEIYESVRGVEEAISGYAGGEMRSPSYEEVSSGKTDHAETVKVLYDPDEVDLKTLVDVYYASQNPTTRGQAPDFGPQYRSIIFYTDPHEKKVATRYRDSLDNSGAYDKDVVTEIQPLQKFWKAESYHQDYAKKNPDDRYIQNISKERFRDFKEKMPEVVEESDGH